LTIALTDPTPGCGRDRLRWFTKRPKYSILADMNVISSQAQLSDLLDRYGRLGPGEKLIMQMKSLVCLPTTKTVFLTCLTKAGLRASDGKLWSFASVNAVLDALVGQGLLTQELACPMVLFHQLSVDAAASENGTALIGAVRNAFPGQRVSYASVSYPDPETLMRGLRLAIYANDAEDFAKIRARFDIELAPRRAADFLAMLLASEPLEPNWLAGRHPTIQRALFEAKIVAFVETGMPAPDLESLFDRFRAQRYTKEFASVLPILLQYDLLAGRMDDLHQGMAAIDDKSGETYLTLQGAVAFLEGRNEVALAQYRGALKLRRKRLGRRKVFFGDVHGLLFLMTLLQAHDAALHPEIQTGVELAAAEPSPYAAGFLAIQALLWLAQGLQTKATELLGRLRKHMPVEPLSAACIILAEHASGGDLAKKHRTDIHRRFEALKDRLPLVARIHAEVLAATSPAPGPFAAYVAATAGSLGIVFTRIIQIRQPWERALESLDAFLGAGATSAGPARVPGKAKRLAWFVNPDTQHIEAVEQSSKGGGWTDGRPVAMKRLHEQDPRLDYLTVQDRAALRTIRRETTGWYGDDNYHFDPLRAMPALVGHPTVFDARHRARLLELVAYPVELVVTEQSAGYRLALSHTAEEPSIFLEAETPLRYRVVEFPQRMLAVQEILGKRGLTVPRSARDQVIAMVRRDNPSLPIRAEIAEIEAPGIEGVTTPWCNFCGRTTECGPVLSCARSVRRGRPMSRVWVAGPFWRPSPASRRAPTAIWCASLLTGQTW
jgi:hypothetical protein